MSADDLLARAQTQLDMFERRDTTAVPGTVSLVRDLAAEVRRLRAERDALRSVVRHYHQGDVLLGTTDGPEWHTPPWGTPAAVPIPAAEADAIRAALKGTGQ